jgi:FkbM family methyltransferase
MARSHMSTMPGPRAVVSLYKTLRLHAAPLHPFIRAVASFILRFLMTIKRFDCPLEETRFCYRYLLGLHEPGTTAAIKKIVRTGMTVVDVGAHLGYFTALFAGLVGRKGRVYAFEPDPKTFDFLRRNTARFGNVHPLNAAVLDHDASATLYRSQRSSHNSLWAENVDLPIGSVSVRAVRLDGVLGEISPDFVKIDAEGCELEVLDSMKEIFARAPKMTLLVELNPSRLSGRRRSPDELLRKLTGLGFDIGFVNEKTGGVENISRSLADLEAGLNRVRDLSYVNLLCTKQETSSAWPPAMRQGLRPAERQDRRPERSRS